MQEQNVFFATNNYQNLKDEEIISEIKAGDESLFRKSACEI